MQIIHRISIASNPAIQRELARLGIAVAGSGFVSFDVDESNTAFPALEEWVAHRQAVDVPLTKFSKKEIAAARWLEIVPDWHHGYPQPEAEFRYLEVSYDLADWCERCGIGRKQKAPFRMKGEPKWGRRGILQLNWVFDEFFVTPDVWAGVFKPFGVGYRPVLNTTGVELSTVVQLVVLEEVDVLTDSLGTEQLSCAKCGRTKYLPVARGRPPAIVTEPSTSMVKTRQHFGSGASAHRGVLLSQNIAHTLVGNEVRGASLKPLDDGS